MSLNSYNQLITNISQITNQNINIDHDNVITIDTLNNQLGIKKRNPSCELDVSGKIRCNTIEFIDPTNILNFNNGEISLNTLNIQQIKSISNSLTTSTFKYNIDVSNIKSNNIDVSNININEHLDVSTINVSQIDVSSINIKNAATIDCSLIFTSNNGISCENILVNNIYCNEPSLNIIGNLLISGDLSVNGTVFGKDSRNGSNFGFLSDDRLKHNEKKIVNGLEIIRKLEPQKYQKTKNFKHPDFSGIVNEAYIIESGLIAQDVFKINDVSYTVTVGDDTNPYYLNYNDLFVYTIAGLKELDTFVQTIPEYTSIKNLANIENLLNNQNNIIQKLNTKISLLENRIYLLERK